MLYYRLGKHAAAREPCWRSLLRQPDMKAKARLIDFLRRTSGPDSPKLYEFIVDGNIGDAHAYVQRMRVELSRLRAIVRESGKQQRAFKMRVETMEAISPVETRVVLRFHEPHDIRVSHTVAEVFSALTTGHATIEPTSNIVLKRRQHVET